MLSEQQKKKTTPPKIWICIIAIFTLKKQKRDADTRYPQAQTPALHSPAPHSNILTEIVISGP